MEEKIFNMLKEIRPEQDFTESEDFIEEGLLDSFDVISLVSMIEEQWGIIIDGLDVVPENFSSIDGIISLIKKSGGSV